MRGHIEITILMRYNAIFIDNCVFSCTKFKMFKIITYNTEETLRLMVDSGDSETKTESITVCNII